MSRAVRLAKQSAKRHHLHVEATEMDELNTGLIFTSASRALFTARGIVGETDTTLQVREIKLKAQPAHKAQTFEVTLVAVPALADLKFLISPKQPLDELSVLYGHIFATWLSHGLDKHQLYYPPSSEDYQMYLIRASEHLATGWCLESTGSHLQLFKIPAEPDPDKLEDALRLAGELRPLLVPA